VAAVDIVTTTASEKRLDVLGWSVEEALTTPVK
jgi:hypothetical protein